MIKRLSKKKVKGKNFDFEQIKIPNTYIEKGTLTTDKKKIKRLQKYLGAEKYYAMIDFQTQNTLYKTVTNYLDSNIDFIREKIGLSVDKMLYEGKSYPIESENEDEDIIENDYFEIVLQRSIEREDE